MSDPFGGEPATMNGGDMFQVSLRHPQPAEAWLTTTRFLEKKNQEHYFLN